MVLTPAWVWGARVAAVVAAFYALLAATMAGRGYTADPLTEFLSSAVQVIAYGLLTMLVVRVWRMLRGSP